MPDNFPIIGRVIARQKVGPMEEVSTNNFRPKLVEQIREKQERKKVLEQQRFELITEIKALEQELEQLETALGVHDQLMGIASPQTSRANSNAKRFQYATIADSCAAIMRELGGHAKTRELMERLTKAGKLTTNYKTAYSSVLKALQRDERFEQLGRGEFALKDIAR